MSVMPSTGSRRVLLVEDHADVATGMTMLLAMLGHKTTIAVSIAHALEAASSEPFDFILADYSLPDGSAADLVARLRALDGPAKNLAVVLLTGHNIESLGPGVVSQFCCCLIKPAELGPLQKGIEAAMAWRSDRG
jgi:CheY-like chemotaxis protein